LGHTVPELNITEYSKNKFEKLQFSMMIPELANHLKTDLKHIRFFLIHSSSCTLFSMTRIFSILQVNTVILCGIETHACIRHTTIDLIEQGFNVHIVVDACSSRTMVDR
jgi:nicotinamidase-related amidase